jgi:hypothetical protein
VYIIDRFENNWAVVEYNRKTFNLPRELVPPEALEGDVISIKVSVDPMATARLKEDVAETAGKLFED